MHVPTAFCFSVWTLRSHELLRSDRRRALGEEVARAAGRVVRVGHGASGRTSGTAGLAATEGTPLTGRQVMPGQSAVAADVLAAGVTRTVVALTAVAATMDAEPMPAGEIAAGTITAASPVASAGTVAATTVGAVAIGATLQVADLLHAVAIRTVALDDRTGGNPWLTRVRAVDVEQKKPIDDRTAAARRDDHSSEAHIEHVFHGEIPSVRKRRPAAMGRRTGSSETTGGIGRAATAG